MATLQNKKLIPADFEENNFAHFLKRFDDFRAKMFCSNLAEMKIVLCNVAMGNKRYKIFIFFASKIEAFGANLSLQNRFHGFSRRGYVFVLLACLIKFSIQLILAQNNLSENYHFTPFLG